MGRRRKSGGAGAGVLFVGLITIYLIVMAIDQFLDWWNTIAGSSQFLIVSGIICCIVLIFIYKKWKRKNGERIAAEQRRNRLIREGNLRALRKMTPRNFEYFVADLFTEMGYQAEVTKATGDGGKDIILNKQKSKSVAECKRYKDKKISVNLIRQFHSVIIDEVAEKGYYVTTSDFTKDARGYIVNKPIDLIDGEALLNLIQDMKWNRLPEEADLQTES